MSARVDLPSRRTFAGQERHRRQRVRLDRGGAGASCSGGRRGRRRTSSCTCRQSRRSLARPETSRRGARSWVATRRCASRSAGATPATPDARRRGARRRSASPVSGPTRSGRRTQRGRAWRWSSRGASREEGTYTWNRLMRLLAPYRARVRSGTRNRRQSFTSVAATTTSASERRLFETSMKRTAAGRARFKGTPRARRPRQRAYAARMRSNCSIRAGTAVYRLPCSVNKPAPQAPECVGSQKNDPRPLAVW